MTLRVATFAQSSTMIADALRIQSVMANEQIQESSGVLTGTRARRTTPSADVRCPLLIAARISALDAGLLPPR